MNIKVILRRLFSKINPSEVKYRKHLRKRFKDYFSTVTVEDNMLYKEANIWHKLFLNMLEESVGSNINYVDKLFTGFAQEKLKLQKIADSSADYSAPIVICAQKNNIVYLKKFLPYYRALGVKHFVFIDNNSSDESFVFLMEQNDVSLFSAPFNFNGVKKAGWKMQALSYFGLNHWYLWLDSDEFLAYPQMESINLEEYIRIMDLKKISNVGGFMLDMYPNYTLMCDNKNPEKFYEDYIYFDGDSGYYQFDDDILHGGMRGRFLNVYDLRLDKTPLFFASNNNIPSGNHVTYPSRRNLKDNYGCVLKHYKFLSSDTKKYKELSMDDNNGYWTAESQKKYLEFIGKSVMFEGSIRYVDSTSLKVFPYVKDFTL